MISHEEFTQLSLTRFLDTADIEEREEWEFAGEVWEGEAFVFTEFLRRKSTPWQLGCINVDLIEFPKWKEVLEVLDLDLAKGMSPESAREILGPSIRRSQWSDDRWTEAYQLDQESLSGC